MTATKTPTLFVSSAVYGNEEMLNQLFSVLKGFGYKVWMSHRGSFFASSDKSNFTNCLRAVRECDLFFGIITPSYGTGKEKGKTSITHQEMQLAIKLDKPRWFMAHENVVFSRRLLNDLGFDNSIKRGALTLKSGAKMISDLRLIDMYEEATLHNVPLEKRKGNWVHEFNCSKDVLEYAEDQLSDIERVKPLIQIPAPAKTKVRKGGAK